MKKRLQLAAVAAMMGFGAMAQINVTAPNNYVGIGTAYPCDKLQIRNADDGGADNYSGIRFLPATSATSGFASYHRILGTRKSGLWIGGDCANGGMVRSNMWFKDDNIWFGFSDGSSDPETHPIMRIANNPTNTQYFSVSTYNGFPVIYPGNNAGYLGRHDRQFRNIYTDELMVQMVNVYSDETLKENITPMQNTLQRVCATKGYTYNLKDTKAQTNDVNLVTTAATLSSTSNTVDAKPTESVSAAIDSTSLPENVKRIAGLKNKIGFIAQDLQKTFPELVTYNDDSNLYTVDYIGMIPALVESIKEQQTQIVAQQQADANQKTLIASQQAVISKQQAQVAAQQKQIDALIKAVDKLKK